ncbi:translation machinery-associated protein 16 homolog [Anopheles cruzii]|uniref:translation machinery-associated protein 16 homolog n=1 Tax=Anopheles cruzii TaxID=68878 RepID=UPI0022EC95CA|nr:translation machinery-associated protein 16 homolog [Anopheles cruzii]
MPKQTVLKGLAKCKHPNSRKTQALARQIKKISNREKKKLGHAAKANILGMKLAWFAEKVEGRDRPITPSEYEQLIDLYLQRFDEELEQIKIVQSIGKHRINQHASRESVIRTTIDTEKQHFAGGGIELPDLCNAEHFKLFQEWNGDAASVQHLALEFVSRKLLQSKAVNNESTNSDQQMAES